MFQLQLLQEGEGPGKEGQPTVSVTLIKVDMLDYVAFLRPIQFYQIQHLLIL